MASVNSAAQQLEVKLRTQGLPSGCFDIQALVVKKGPRHYKTVSLLKFGDKASGEVRKRELRVQTWSAKREGAGFDFTQTENAWHCEDSEIDAVLAFLAGQLESPGIYARVDPMSPLAKVISALKAGSIDAQQIDSLIAALAESEDAKEQLADRESAVELIQGIQLIQQRQTFKKLRAAVSDPQTREPVLQAVLERNWWIFGGRYVGKTLRRSFTVLDQYDIPLIRADGSLHIVELKIANVPKLVVPHRNHFVVGPEINEAVGQAINYLRALDEQRATILADLGIECRRASVTVVIGHSQFITGVDSKSVAETIRTYNAHLSRVEVVTYEDLIAGIEQTLAILTAQEAQDD